MLLTDKKIPMKLSDIVDSTEIVWYLQKTTLKSQLVFNKRLNSLKQLPEDPGFKTPDESNFLNLNFRFIRGT
jgi:hypothetical protein